ncbi:CarD family transcriptional regulator [Robinsoniella peoriensis]|uniref:CarD family transcriptional regulator n=1 Tax=Robinsoniella peoriensis TaxID=180332 RepID=UPI00362A18D7
MVSLRKCYFLHGLRTIGKYVLYNYHGICVIEEISDGKKSSDTIHSLYHVVQRRDHSHLYEFQ